MGRGDERARQAVFVVGMERSGTSLLRSILNGSRELAVAPETHFVNRWLPRWAGQDASNPMVFERFWNEFTASQHFAKLQVEPDLVWDSLRDGGIECWRDVHVGLLAAFASARGRVRLGEKVPAYFRHIDRLLEWYPDARIVYSVRDPRAVVASHRVLDEPWAAGSDYELCRKWRQRASAAVRWAEHPQVEIVRYEDLVDDAGHTVRAICRFVGIEPSDEMLMRASPAASHDRVDPAGAVADTQVAAWRQRLSPRQAELIAWATRSESISLGYDSTADLPLSARARFAAEAAAFAARASWKRTPFAAGRVSR